MAVEDKDKAIIRARVSSVVPYGGTICCDVSGTFSGEEALDAIEMLNIVIRSIQRQHDRAFSDSRAGEEKKGGAGALTDRH